MGCIRGRFGASKRNVWRCGRVCCCGWGIRGQGFVEDAPRVFTTYTGEISWIADGDRL